MSQPTQAPTANTSIANQPSNYKQLNADFLDFYQEKLAAHLYEIDAAQKKTADALNLFYQQNKDHTKNKIWGWLRKIPPFKSKNIGSSSANNCYGVYIFGGVGRGKSFLMDAFYEWLPHPQKKRVHFHEFMRDIHRNLHELRHQENAMRTICQKLAKELKYLCFDEFHVSDIADAMLLERLIQHFFELGVHLILTSNYAPNGLYPNGLNRERFLPAIELLNQLKVLNLDHGTDYRLNKLSSTQLVFNSKLPESNIFMRDLWVSFLGLSKIEAQKFLQQPQTIDIDAQNQQPFILIEQRKITVTHVYNQAVWFSFEQICNTPRSQNDYLEIAKQYQYIFISEIPKMPPKMLMQARRFTWLIDILYDQKSYLISSAECAFDDLYTEGAFANEFTRTVSRLKDMQSVDYLKRS